MFDLLKQAIFASVGHFGQGGTRRPLELIGGTATIDSEPGKGTYVNVEIPLVQREDAHRHGPFRMSPRMILALGGYDAENSRLQYLEPERMCWAMARDAAFASPANRASMIAKCSPGLAHDPQMILFVFPGDVPERAEQQLQAADLFRQEAIAAGFGDQIVQLAVRLSRPGEEQLGRPLGRLEFPKRFRQLLEFGQFDPATGLANGFTLQRPPDLTDLPDIHRRDPPDDGPTVRHQVDDADRFEGHQRFTNRGGTDLVAFREVVDHQMLACSQPSLEDVPQQGRDDQVSPLPVIAPRARSRGPLLALRLCCSLKPPAGCSYANRSITGCPLPSCVA